MKFKIKEYILLTLSFMCIVLLETSESWSEIKYYTDIESYIADNYAEREQNGVKVYPSTADVPGNNTTQPSTQNTTPSEKKVVKSCDHTYETTVVKEATCKDEGELKFVCSQCGDSYTQKTAATGEHNYESIVTTEATCTEAGVMTYTCVDCGDAYTEQIAALDHLAGDAVTTKESGWFTEGEKQYPCQKCGEILSTVSVPSKYPIWYLYTVIGVVVVAGVAVTVILLKRKKKNE